MDTDSNLPELVPSEKIPQHSTPIKASSKHSNKHHFDMDDMKPSKLSSKHSKQVITDTNKIFPDAHFTDDVNIAWKQRQSQLLSDFESKTIQKQRQELQLLITELKSRDTELNDMVIAHQRQLQAWEKDRQKILRLEEANAQLLKEMDDTREEVHQLRAKLRVVEKEEMSRSTALEMIQDQLVRVTEDNCQMERELHDLQDHSQHVTSTSDKLTNRIEELEAKEQELLRVLQSKDRDLSDAASRVAELNSKLKTVGGEVEQSRMSDKEQRLQLAEWKRRCGEEERDKEQAKKQQAKVEELLQEQNVELQKLRQELVASKREIVVVVDREKRKDQLLELQRSKQDRTELELTNLRQLYERQQQDLTLLHLNLESSRDLLDKYQKGFFTDKSRKPNSFSSDNNRGQSVPRDQSSMRVSEQDQNAALSYNQWSNSDSKGARDAAVIANKCLAQQFDIVCARREYEGSPHKPDKLSALINSSEHKETNEGQTWTHLAYRSYQERSATVYQAGDSQYEEVASNSNSSARHGTSERGKAEDYQTAAGRGQLAAIRAASSVSQEQSSRKLPSFSRNVSRVAGDEDREAVEDELSFFGTDTDQQSISCVTRSARLASQGLHGVSGGLDSLTLPPSISTSLRSSCLSLNLTSETNNNGNVSFSKSRPEVESEVTSSRDRDMLMAHSNTLTSPPLTLTQVTIARDTQPTSSSSRASSIHSNSAHAPPLRTQQDTEPSSVDKVTSSSVSKWASADVCRETDWRSATPLTQVQRMESPATKLHKVLRESKQIVDSLERSSGSEQYAD